MSLREYACEDVAESPEWQPIYEYLREALSDYYRKHGKNPATANLIAFNMVKEACLSGIDPYTLDVNEIDRENVFDSWNRLLKRLKPVSTEEELLKRLDERTLREWEAMEDVWNLESLKNHLENVKVTRAGREVPFPATKVGRRVMRILDELIEKKRREAEARRAFYAGRYWRR